MTVTRRTGYVGYLLRALFLPMAVLCLASARSAAGVISAGEGFGDLTWGSTVEQALAVYPDLRFAGYRIVNEKEVPFQAYARERASDRVDGVKFDSLEYWFRGDRFVGIRAVLNSRIGPRTLVTEAERSYDILADRILRAYGAPSQRTVKYVTEYLAVIKGMTWETRGVTIRLQYNGVGEGDVDRLTLDMGKGGRVP
jgi:hypothetical protein